MNLGRSYELMGRPLLGGCGSFYAIIIASDRFKGLSMVKQHQLVNEALKSEIKSIHGLQVCHLSFPFNCVTPNSHLSRLFRDT